MGGGSDTTQQTQSQSVTQLPPWINTAAQQNYAQAQNVASRPLQQYQGQLVPDVGPQMQQAWNTAATGASAGQPQYDASQAGFLGVLGQQPMNVQAGQLSNTNLQPYMNPYTQSVINKTLPIMQQNLGLQQNQQQNAANSANAFGGSRQGVQQGVTQAQGAMGMGQMAAQLNQANFGQAQTAAQNDIANRLKAAQGNQQAQQSQGQLNIAAAGGLGTLGSQAQANQRAAFGEQAAAGQLEQQQQQNQITAQLNKFNQAWGYPQQQLNTLMTALGMTPYGQAQQGQSTTETQQSANPMQEILGGLTTAGSLFGGGGPFAALLGGAKAGAGANKGMTKVPGPLSAPPDLDMVPAALAPGEAVLNREAAESLGRGKIQALNRAGLARRVGSPLGGAGPQMAPMGPGLPQGRSGPTPGPLAAPSMGSPMMKRPARRMGKTRYPPVRGALGG